MVWIRDILYDDSVYIWLHQSELLNTGMCRIGIHMADLTMFDLCILSVDPGIDQWNHKQTNSRSKCLTPPSKPGTPSHHSHSTSQSCDTFPLIHIITCGMQEVNGDKCYWLAIKSKHYINVCTEFDLRCGTFCLYVLLWNVLSVSATSGTCKMSPQSCSITYWIHAESRNQCKLPWTCSMFSLGCPFSPAV